MKIYTSVFFHIFSMLGSSPRNLSWALHELSANLNVEPRSKIFSVKFQVIIVYITIYLHFCTSHLTWIVWINPLYKWKHICLCKARSIHPSLHPTIHPYIHQLALWGRGSNRRLRVLVTGGHTWIMGVTQWNMTCGSSFYPHKFTRSQRLLVQLIH